LQLNIFFNPAELALVEAPARDIYIVIDAMRATTTLTVMCDAGAKQILIAQTIEQALSAAQMIPGRLLCGESHTQTPPGFDFGNSPALFADLDLTGKDLILTTSNGTRALPAQNTAFGWLAAFIMLRLLQPTPYVSHGSSSAISPLYVLLSTAILPLKMPPVLVILR
jgi:phosphosulfolactate phosphohydrolase-like enzyme